MLALEPSNRLKLRLNALNKRKVVLKMDQQQDKQPETLESVLEQIEIMVAEAKQINSTASTTPSFISSPEPRCKLCDDHGVVIDMENNCAVPCKCQEERRRERLFKNSKITPAFKAKSFDNFKPKGRPAIVAEMLISARHYANNFGELGENNWLVLLGEPGSGKTHLSMAVANQLISQGVPVLYFPHVEGMSELRSTFNKNGEDSLEDKLQQMRKVDLLVWDDLFKGRKDPTAWSVEIVFDVLNYRYLNLLPTIISSELVPAQIMAVDETGGIGSRILERGKGHTVVVSGLECNYRLGGV